MPVMSSVFVSALLWQLSCSDPCWSHATKDLCSPFLALALWSRLKVLDVRNRVLKYSAFEIITEGIDN